MDPYDVYRVNDDLIATLTAEKRIVPVSYEFSQIKSNAMKVKFVLRFLCKYQRIPDIELRRPKNNEKARALRQNGNKLFALKGVNLFKALELYNQSICMAERGLQDFSIALANRSAVYLELRMPGLCMKNIRHARLSGYPDKLMDKLVKREMECLMAIEKHNSKVREDTANGTRWRTDVHKEVTSLDRRLEPFVAAFLDRQQTESFGRFIVSKQRLHPGDMLAIEDPFTCILLPAMRYQRCWHCLHENKMNLLPCMSCTQAMFCSQACFTKAQSTYHPYECPIIDYLLALFNKLHLLALRVTIMSVLAFGSLTKLGEFLSEHGATEVDVYTTPPDATELAACYANDEQRRFHQVFMSNLYSSLFDY